ncbi:neuroguidin [Malaya genurostris]|uniref:neuroguidin n=1 Tax=Malaya genurostris TaxID=325434 RepID=UPI0026F37E4A|nr:neuroguidin [Malaya genurostris]XP_058447587.1 neuroguidin [Malaya genurostris]
MVQAIDEYDIQPDLPQALRLLDEMNNNFKQVSDHVGTMLQRVKTGELSTEYGLNFLEIKYHMLLNYLINLTYVVLRKCSGHKIEKDPSIDRLIEIRTVLEKIRPIDYKLRYQIDKLVKTAVTGTSAANDPISFKANPANLMSQIPETAEGADSGDDSDDSAKIMQKLRKAKASKSGASAEYGGSNDVYVPPKHMAVPYEDDSKTERERKQMARARKRVLGSSLIQELKEEFLDTPLEVSSSSRALRVLSRKEREREEYEEKYLTRLPMTKADKHRSRKLTTLGTLGEELTSFGDMSALDDELPSSSTGGKKRKASKGGKKHGKKRRFR